MLHCTVLYCTVLPVLYCTVLSVLYCTVLHCTSCTEASHVTLKSPLPRQSLHCPVGSVGLRGRPRRGRRGCRRRERRWRSRGETRRRSRGGGERSNCWTELFDLWRPHDFGDSSFWQNIYLLVFFVSIWAETSALE